MRNVLSIMLCVGVSIAILFSGFSMAVDLVVVEYESTGSVVSAYAGFVIAENRTDDLEEPSGLGWDAGAVALVEKWDNLNNQSINKMEAIQDRLDRDLFYYGRLAESRSALFVDRDHDLETAQNISEPMMRDYSQMMDSIAEEIESSDRVMLDKGYSWNQDPDDDRRIRFFNDVIVSNLNDDDFDLLTGYRQIPTTSEEYRFYYASSVYLIPDLSLGYCRVDFVNYSHPSNQNFTIELSSEARIELNGNYYIHVSVGEVIVRGINQRIDGGVDGGWTTHLYDNWNYEYSYDSSVKRIEIWNSTTYEIIEHKAHSARNPTIQLISAIEEIYDAVSTIGANKHTYYTVVKGYDRFAEIPPSELVYPPSLLFWGSDLLDEITDPVESLAIMYSYFDWLNRTEFDHNNTHVIEAYKTNFTNIDLVSNITLQIATTNYSGAGSITGWYVSEIVFSSDRAIIIPLEDSLTLTTGSARNVSQDALIIDVDTFEAYEYSHYDGARISRSVNDYRINVHDLVEDGSPVLEGDYVRTSLAEYVEDNYDIGIPEPRPDEIGITPSIDAGIPSEYYLYGVGLVAIVIVFVSISRR